MRLSQLKLEHPYLLKDYETKKPVAQQFTQQISFPNRYAKDIGFVQLFFYKFMTDQSRLISFLKFWENYRQMFSFEPELSHMLSLTEIGEIPWDEIKLPYQDFYISFGNFDQEIFTLQQFNYIIDGAFITTFEGESLILPENSIMIEFTSRLIYPSYEEAIQQVQEEGVIFSEPTYTFILAGQSGQKIQDAFNQGEETFLKYCENMDEINYTNSLEFAKNLGVAGTEKINPYLERYSRGKQYIHSMLPVLFNCIFYLAQYPESIVEKYQDDTPKGLIEKINRATTETQKNRNRKKINDHGYSRIKFVHSVIKSESNIETGREVSTHWRRGHWRNQPYGHGLSSHKYLWIHPTVVRKDKGEPIDGHLYQV